MGPSARRPPPAPSWPPSRFLGRICPVRVGGAPPAGRVVAARGLGYVAGKPRPEREAPRPSPRPCGRESSVLHPTPWGTTSRASPTVQSPAEPEPGCGSERHFDPPAHRRVWCPPWPRPRWLESELLRGARQRPKVRPRNPFLRQRAAQRGPAGQAQPAARQFFRPVGPSSDSAPPGPRLGTVTRSPACFPERRWHRQVVSRASVQVPEVACSRGHGETSEAGRGRLRGSGIVAGKSRCGKPRWALAALAVACCCKREPRRGARRRAETPSRKPSLRQRVAREASTGRAQSANPHCLDV